MVGRIRIDGEVLKELRHVRAMSQAALAQACRDLPGREGSHVTREDISRYERGVRQPTPGQLDRIIKALDKVLKLTREERYALVPTPALDAALAATNGHDMNRRDLGKLAAASGALAVLARIELGELSLHEATQELIRRYPTTPPAESFETARAVLNRQFRVLDTTAMLGHERRGLLVDAADTAVLAGWAARIAGQPADAAASFALAEQLAAETDLAVVRGLVLACRATLHRPISGDGDALAGLELARAAEPLVGSRGGPLAQYTVGLQAELLAALGPEHEHDSLRLLDRAVAISDGDDRTGFISSQAMLPAQWAASCYTQLESPNQALEHLEQAMATNDQNTPRGQALTQVQIAHAHAVAGDPEATCHHAQLALDGSLATGYDLGIRRVRFARAALPDGCDGLACVRELDDRLATV